MSLRCARLGCEREAAASLLFKAEASEVHLINLAEATAGIPLCAKHARTRTAPVGWVIIDYRTPTQSELWSADAPPPSLLGPSERPPLRRAADPASTDPAPEVPVPDAVVPDAVVPDAVAPHAVVPSDFEWGRAANPDRHRAPELNAETPLLARAFRSVS
jgi:hypothetical protein